MADLNVQPKKKAPIWPWLLLLLIIVAVVYFLMRGRDSDGTTNDGTTTTDSVNQYRSDTLSP